MVTPTRKLGILYSPSDVRIVRAEGPAVYELVAGSYHLLRGMQSPDLIVEDHEWMTPTRCSVEPQDENDHRFDEGVVCLMNLQEFKVKHHPTVTLACHEEYALDQNSIRYEITRAVSGYWDCRFGERGNCVPERERLDKTRADSTAVVELNRRAMPYSDFQDYLLDTYENPGTTLFRDPQIEFKTLAAYRAKIVDRTDVPPYQWQLPATTGIAAKKHEVSYAALVREIFLKKRLVSLQSFDDETRRLGIYFRGGQAVPVAPLVQAPLKVWPFRKAFITSARTRDTIAAVSVSVTTALKYVDMTYVVSNIKTHPVLPYVEIFVQYTTRLRPIRLNMIQVQGYKPLVQREPNMVVHTKLKFKT